jgi:hypothetical protein
MLPIPGTSDAAPGRQHQRNLASHAANDTGGSGATAMKPVIQLQAIDEGNDK